MTLFKSNKLKILIFFFIVLTVKLNAQNYHFPRLENSPKWSVLKCIAGIGFICNTEWYSYEKDTIMCGYTYYKVSSSSVNIEGYLRIDNERVFIKKNNNCNDVEYLIYDFSLYVGDTVYCGIQTGTLDSAEFWVTDIDSIYINNSFRKRIKLNYYEVPPPYPLVRGMNWIEGIGSDIHPYYPLVYFYQPSETSYKLLCYDSLDNTIYQNNSFNTCDTSFILSYGNILNSQDYISVFPNPFVKEFTIKLNLKNTGNISIDIFDSLSKKIKTIEERKLHPGQFYYTYGNKLKPGMYIISFQKDKKRYNFKIIKLKKQI